MATLAKCEQEPAPAYLRTRPLRLGQLARSPLGLQTVSERGLRAAFAFLSDACARTLLDGFLLVLVLLRGRSFMSDEQSSADCAWRVHGLLMVPVEVPAGLDRLPPSYSTGLLMRADFSLASPRHRRIRRVTTAHRPAGIRRPRGRRVRTRRRRSSHRRSDRGGSDGPGPLQPHPPDVGRRCPVRAGRSASTTVCMEANR
jgi:hypothetical protein